MQTGLFDVARTQTELLIDSPTGRIVAQVTLHFSRKDIKEDEPFVVASLLGTCFTGRVVKTTSFGDYQAVIPEVTGSSYIVGRSEWLIDPKDPLYHGFLLR